MQWVQTAHDSYDPRALCCDSGQKSFRGSLWPEVKRTGRRSMEMYREGATARWSGCGPIAYSAFWLRTCRTLAGHAEGDDVIARCAHGPPKQGTRSSLPAVIGMLQPRPR